MQRLASCLAAHVPIIDEYLSLITLLLLTEKYQVIEQEDGKHQN